VPETPQTCAVSVFPGPSRFFCRRHYSSPAPVREKGGLVRERISSSRNEGARAAIGPHGRSVSEQRGPYTTASGQSRANVFGNELWRFLIELNFD
jgi:hypothetical protein